MRCWGWGGVELWSDEMEVVMRDYGDTDVEMLSWNHHRFWTQRGGLCRFFEELFVVRRRH